MDTTTPVRVLITGMSGTGKPSVTTALRRRSATLEIDTKAPLEQVVRDILAHTADG